MELIMLDGESVYDEIEQFPDLVKKGQRFIYRRDEDNEELHVVAIADGEIVTSTRGGYIKRVFQEVQVKVTVATSNW